MGPQERDRSSLQLGDGAIFSLIATKGHPLQFGDVTFIAKCNFGTDPYLSARLSNELRKCLLVHKYEKVN